MSTVFVSYSRESKQQAESLAKDLESLGHEAWFDQQLTGGQAWWNLILENIRKCDLFAFALTPAALDSPACRREYTYAADLKKTILPVLVADGVSIDLLPEALAQIQYVDYRQEDKEAFRSLARALGAAPASSPLPDPLPAPPPAPVSYLGSLREKVETSNVLSFEEQTGLVIKLKHGLREAKQADDVLGLLKTFRGREDLYARVADEIDSLLITPATPTVEPQPTKPSVRPRPTKPTIEPQPTKPTVERQAAKPVELNPAEPTPNARALEVPPVSAFSSENEANTADSRAYSFESFSASRYSFHNFISGFSRYVWMSLLGGVLIAIAMQVFGLREFGLVVSIYSPSWSIPAALILTIAIVWKGLESRSLPFTLLVIALCFVPSILAVAAMPDYFDVYEYYYVSPWQVRLLLALIPLVILAIVLRPNLGTSGAQAKSKPTPVILVSLFVGLVISAFVSRSFLAITLLRLLQPGLALLFLILIALILIDKVKNRSKKENSNQPTSIFNR